MIRKISAWSKWTKSIAGTDPFYSENNITHHPRHHISDEQHNPCHHVDNKKKGGIISQHNLYKMALKGIWRFRAGDREEMS
jgi:hypothetical protein